jgi:hypothetical protein
MPPAQAVGFLKNNGSGTLSWNSDVVIGPASATTNAIARYDGTTGKLIKNSAVTVNDTGDLSNVGTINMQTGGSSFISNVTQLIFRGVTSGSLGINAANTTTTHSLVLPSALGDSGTYLKTSGTGGTGTLSWSDIRNDLRLWYFDDLFSEQSTNNGMLGWLIGGSGTGSVTAATTYENNHFGILRMNTAASATNCSWTGRQGLLWSQIKYFEFVFRPWPTGATTSSICSVGLYATRTSTTPNHLSLQYNTAAPAEGWCIKTYNFGNGILTYSFTNANLTSQNSNVWLKIRITNVDDAGSWTATLTRMDTNVSETLSPNSFDAGNLSIPSAGVFGFVIQSSNSTTKYVDMDSFELQLKNV